MSAAPDKSWLLVRNLYYTDCLTYVFPEGSTRHEFMYPREPENVVIERVVPASVAEKAGFLAGDVITSINGWPASDEVIFAKRLSVMMTREGQLAFTVLREGEEHELVITEKASIFGLQVKSQEGLDFNNFYQPYLIEDWSIDSNDGTLLVSYSDFTLRKPYGSSINGYIRYGEDNFGPFEREKDDYYTRISNTWSGISYALGVQGGRNAQLFSFIKGKAAVGPPVQSVDTVWNQNLHQNIYLLLSKDASTLVWYYKVDNYNFKLRIGTQEIGPVRWAGLSADGKTLAYRDTNGKIFVGGKSIGNYSYAAFRENSLHLRNIPNDADKAAYYLNGTVYGPYTGNMVWPYFDQYSLSVTNASGSSLAWIHSKVLNSNNGRRYSVYENGKVIDTFSSSTPMWIRYLRNDSLAIYAVSGTEGFLWVGKNKYGPFNFLENTAITHNQYKFTGLLPNTMNLRSTVDGKYISLSSTRNKNFQTNETIDSLNFVVFDGKVFPGRILGNADNPVIMYADGGEVITITY